MDHSANVASFEELKDTSVTTHRVHDEWSPQGLGERHVRHEERFLGVARKLGLKARVQAGLADEVRTLLSRKAHEQARFIGVARHVLWMNTTAPNRVTHGLRRALGEWPLSRGDTWDRESVHTRATCTPNVLGGGGGGEKIKVYVRVEHAAY